MKTMIRKAHTALTRAFVLILAAGFASAATASVGFNAVTTVPQTNFNGAVVTAHYTSWTEGGTATITVGNVNVVGTVDTAAQTVSFFVPGETALASNIYAGRIKVMAANSDIVYSNTAWLYQGAPVAGTPEGWFATSATGKTLNEQGGAWDATSPHVKPPAKDNKIIFDEDESTGVYNDFVFTPDAAENQGQATVVDMNLSFDAALDKLMNVGNAQAGLGLVAVGEDAYRFVAVINGVWTTNTTIEAALNTEYPVRLTFDYRRIPATVTYAVKVDDAYQTIMNGVSGTTKSALANATFNGTGKLAQMTGSNVVDSVDASLVEDDEHNKYANVDQALAAAGATGLTLLWDASWNPSQMRAGNWTISANGHKLYTSTDGVKIDFDGTSYTVTGDYWEVANLLFGATSVTTNKFMYFTNAVISGGSEITNLYLLRDVELPAGVTIARDIWFNGEDRILSGTTPEFAQGNPTFTIEGGCIGFTPKVGFSLKGGRFKEASKSDWNAYLPDGYVWTKLATEVRPDYWWQPFPSAIAPKTDAEQLLPVKDANGEAVSVVVDKSWSAQVTGKGVDDAAGQAAVFSAKQGNNLTFLDNAILGLTNSVGQADVGNIPVITPHQSTSTTKVTFSLGNVNQKSITDSGARVKYRVYTSGTPGGKDGAVSDATEPNAPVEMPLPSNGVQYYMIEVDTGAVK